MKPTAILTRALTVICATGLAAMVAENAALAQDEKTIAIAVKVAGDPWWSRMEEGLKEYDEANPNVRVFMQGVSQSDGALQAQLIEDLIAQKVDALGIVPISPQTLEPVIAKAQAAGIVVVTHEGETQPTKDFDVEAFDNAAYGRHLMDELASRMGEQGEYAVFVGKLTNVSHNQWVDAAVEYQKEKYPEHDAGRRQERDQRGCRHRLPQGPGAPGRLPEHQGLPGIVVQRSDRHRPGDRGSGPRGQDDRGRHQPGVSRRQPSRVRELST